MPTSDADEIIFYRGTTPNSPGNFLSVNQSKPCGGYTHDFGYIYRAMPAHIAVTTAISTELAY